MKKVIIFFDLEGWWAHTPSDGERYLIESVEKILQILRKYDIKAVFNTCGIVVENFPDLIKTLFSKGHEIASHGYAHENFAQLDVNDLNEILSKTENLIEETIGQKPIGIRSPWVIYNDVVYRVIEKRGYKWVSNKYMTFLEIGSKPDSYFVSGVVIRKPQFLKKMIRELRFRKRWALYPKEPFYVYKKLMEIPLLSSMDGDLLFYISPAQKSPERWLNYAYESLIKQFERSKEHFNLNFHPWLIGSANRPILLDKILNYLSKQKESRFILARDLLNIEAID
jgi:peptidoglycan/xylan/chitin deacetylase (PgdA/CDA1 family)